MEPNKLKEIIWKLFKQLRNRQFPLAPNDFEVLRQALWAGFGWSSREALRDLCVALWAKSRREQEILEALFDELFKDNDIMADWNIETSKVKSGVTPINPINPLDRSRERDKKELPETPPTTESLGGLPQILADDSDFIKNYHFVFIPQFPVNYREIAQAWRRLRQPIRVGPPIELDIEATIAQRTRLGVASEVVLVPRRRNTTRMLLFIDRQGSMVPFHDFTDEIGTAIKQASNLAEVVVYYFKNVPTEGVEEELDEVTLETFLDQSYPHILDPIFSDIPPWPKGWVYDDPELLSPHPLQEIIEAYADGTAVVVISDGGAAKGGYNALRLLNTAALLKVIRLHTKRYVWLNPIRESQWKNSTASQIARHIPMFTLDRWGMYQAVNVLRGQQYFIERPI